MTNLIKLLSEVRAPSQYNTASICFNAGKPETVVCAEIDGIRERQEGELVHLANSPEGDGYCLHYGWVIRPNGKIVWTDSEEIWERNAWRCVR